MPHPSVPLSGSDQQLSAIDDVVKLNQGTSEGPATTKTGDVNNNNTSF